MTFFKKGNLKVVCLLALALFNPQASAIVPYLVFIQNLDFKKVIPVAGNCNINVDTNVLTGSICTEATGDVGHYRIYADPGKNIGIIISSKSDSGDNIATTPSGKISTDSAADVNFSAGVEIFINSGVSGEIDIYIGGRLTLTGNKSFGTIYTANFDVEFNEV